MHLENFTEKGSPLSGLQKCSQTITNQEIGSKVSDGKMVFIALIVALSMFNVVLNIQLKPIGVEIALKSLSFQLRQEQ